MLTAFKAFVVLTVAFFVLKPWLLRRWPDLTRRINWALIASLIAVILFRVLIWLRRS